MSGLKTGGGQIIGIDPKSFEHRKGTEVRARYGLGTFPVVGFVGRQVASKGAATVVQAMETDRRRH